MLARLADLPPDPQRWAFEVKWDGVRALAYSEPGRLRLEARSGNDITKRYPELHRLNRALSSHSAILDGEVVAFDDQGRPSFGRLQHRMHIASEAQAKRLSKESPVAYVIFDLLWLDGHSRHGAALHGPARAPGAPRAEGPELAGARLRRRRRRATCRRRPARRGSRASSPSAWTARTSPGAARWPGARSRTSSAPTWSSAAGCRGRGGGASPSARCSSPSRRKVTCATRGGSAPASRTASSTGSSSCCSPSCATRSRGPPGRSRPAAPCSSSRATSPRSSTSSGRRMVCFVHRPTRACARMSPCHPQPSSTPGGPSAAARRSPSRTASCASPTSTRSSIPRSASRSATSSSTSCTSRPCCCRTSATAHSR